LRNAKTKFKSDFAQGTLLFSKSTMLFLFALRMFVYSICHTRDFTKILPCHSTIPVFGKNLISIFAVTLTLLIFLGCHVDRTSLQLTSPHKTED